MNCPYCSSGSSKVVDKRDKDEGITRRRRECLNCKKRYTTYERVENVDLTVRKKNGELEQYDRSKLMKGIKKSVNQHQIPDQQVENLVDSIEMRLLNRESTEVESTEIGQYVLEGLRELDPLAYIRFASVYKDFESIEQFKRELESLE